MHNFNEYNLEETHKICLINLVAQMLTATDRELFYHTWEKKDSTHYYEVGLNQMAQIAPFDLT